MTTTQAEPVFERYEKIVSRAIELAETRTQWLNDSVEANSDIIECLDDPTMTPEQKLEEISRIAHEFGDRYDAHVSLLQCECQQEGG